MKYHAAIHYRRSIRLKEYDYSLPGAYFITICTQNHDTIFGEITDGKMVLNEYGKIAYTEWDKLPHRYKQMGLDVFQIMPNHFHGIITINDKTEGINTVTIGDIVGAYKSLVANECRKIFKLKKNTWESYGNVIITNMLFAMPLNWKKSGSIFKAIR